MKYVTVASGKTQVSDQISYRVSIIFKLIFLPILAVIQGDYIVMTTRSPSNIIDLIIGILNLCIWISSECFDCVLKILCVDMPAIVVETASKNNKIDVKIFLMNDLIVINNRKGKKVVCTISFLGTC